MTGLDLALDRYFETASMVSVDQLAENGIGVEARDAQPIDRAAARNERRAAGVAEEGIVTDRGLRHSFLPFLR